LGLGRFAIAAQMIFLIGARKETPKHGNYLGRFEPGIFPRANVEAFGVLQLTEIAQDTRPAPQAVEICTGSTEVRQNYGPPVPVFNGYKPAYYPLVN